MITEVFQVNLLKHQDYEKGTACPLLLWRYSCDQSKVLKKCKNFLTSFIFCMVDLKVSLTSPLILFYFQSMLSCLRNVFKAFAGNQFLYKILKIQLFEFWWIFSNFCVNLCRWIEHLLGLQTHFKKNRMHFVLHCEILRPFHIALLLWRYSCDHVWVPCKVKVSNFKKNLISLSNTLDIY